jgi:hypothetical protein
MWEYVSRYSYFIMMIMAVNTANVFRIGSSYLI